MNSVFLSLARITTREATCATNTPVASGLATVLKIVHEATTNVPIVRQIIGSALHIVARRGVTFGLKRTAPLMPK